MKKNTERKAIATRTLLILLVVMVTLIILVAVFVPMLQRLGGTANKTILGGDEGLLAGAHKGGESRDGGAKGIHVFEGTSDEIQAFKTAG
jgi:hypothetical protein